MEAGLAGFEIDCNTEFVGPGGVVVGKQRRQKSLHSRSRLIVHGVVGGSQLRVDLQ